MNNINSRNGLYRGFSFTHPQLKNNLTKLFYFYGNRDVSSDNNINIFALKTNNSVIEIQYCNYNSIVLQNNFSGWIFTFNQETGIVSFNNSTYIAPQNGKLITLFLQ